MDVLVLALHRQPAIEELNREAASAQIDLDDMILELRNMLAIEERDRAAAAAQETLMHQISGDVSTRWQ